MFLKFITLRFIAGIFFRSSLSVINPTFQIYSNLSPNIKSSCLLKLTGVGVRRIPITQRAFPAPSPFLICLQNSESLLPGDVVLMSLFLLPQVCWGGKRLRTIGLSPSESVFWGQKCLSGICVKKEASLQGDVVFSASLLPPMTPAASLRTDIQQLSFFNGLI